MRQASKNLPEIFKVSLGSAILDTRDLVPSSSGSIITTYNFVTGPSSYCTSATRKFLFGNTIMISQQDMITRPESIITPTKDVILLGMTLDTICKYYGI